MTWGMQNRPKYGKGNFIQQSNPTVNLTTRFIDKKIIKSRHGAFNFFSRSYKASQKPIKCYKEKILGSRNTAHSSETKSLLKSKTKIMHLQTFQPRILKTWAEGIFKTHLKKDYFNGLHVPVLFMHVTHAIPHCPQELLNLADSF